MGVEVRVIGCVCAAGPAAAPVVDRELAFTGLVDEVRGVRTNEGRVPLAVGVRERSVAVVAAAPDRTEQAVGEKSSVGAAVHGRSDHGERTEREGYDQQDTRPIDTRLAALVSHPATVRRGERTLATSQSQNCDIARTAFERPWAVVVRAGQRASRRGRNVRPVR
jgi:hypothetical protein